jgi:hypothetical protein
MVTMFIRHKVADYSSWRRAYDDFGPMQKRLGVVQQAVYQAIDDPRDVTITHEFGSPESAQAFAKSDELHEAMGKAGVVGAPTVWFTNPA